MKGKGATYPVDGCNKCVDEDPINGYFWYDGFEGNDGELGDKYYAMGSVIVKPGCTLYVYEVLI